MPLFITFEYTSFNKYTPFILVILHSLFSLRDFLEAKIPFLEA